MFPIGIGAVGYGGVDVGIDGAGDDPFVGLWALKNDNLPPTTTPPRISQANKRTS